LPLSKAQFSGSRSENFIEYLFIRLYIYSKGGSHVGSAHLICLKMGIFAVKHRRLDAIRDLLSNSLVSSQDELRRKLRRRGIQVTQATLSRDIHELRLSKGPGGYALPNGNGTRTVVVEDASPPLVEEMIHSFGLRVRQAMNQVVVRTVMGGAQPVAAALDRTSWPEILGTIAGDDTVLVICLDTRRAGEVETKIRMLLES
jgi:transcriptional regulator of arginine metabolism